MELMTDEPHHVAQIEATRSWPGTQAKCARASIVQSKIFDSY
jgi:hypothetical protein